MLKLILIVICIINHASGQFQKLVGILKRENEGRNNFEILTDEEYAGDGVDLTDLNIHEYS